MTQFAMTDLDSPLLMCGLMTWTPAIAETTAPTEEISEHDDILCRQAIDAHARIMICKGDEQFLSMCFEVSSAGRAHQKRLERGCHRRT